jgi:hypothetical protein
VRFRVHIDGYLDAENIDDAMSQLARHFADPMADDDDLLLNVNIQPAPPAPIRLYR